jgi:uroporphyrinogen III methyltransferase/synthase
VTTPRGGKDDLRKTGKVYLVGAGPGDPKLLTLRGKECLEQADVILYDYLANPVLLDHARPEAERIYVGRRGRGRYGDQEEINRLMIERARAGQTVVRLKGGDPFVFGRGGEEAEAVADAGIPFEVVPGVTAAIAVPAYAGIPVTHRTLASSMAVVTGHEDPTKPSPTVEWDRLAATSGTVVFLMGMKNLPAIVAHLTASGRAVSTPVALIRWGTRATQQTIIGTLENIVKKADEAALEPPTVVVVGDVVNLRSKLNWFESRPLFGTTVLVTRPQEQAAEFSDLLTAYGATVVTFPTIAIVPPTDWHILDQAIDEIASYDWIIFTSVNGVRYFLERLEAAGRDARALAATRLCAIGPRTAAALEAVRLKVDLVPAEYQAEGLLAVFKKEQIKGARILIPRAEVARDLLPDELRAGGADVTVAIAYRTVRPDADMGAFKESLRQGQINVIAFTSSSTVKNYVESFANPGEAIALTEEAVVACIGPITAQTAEACGLKVRILARENTIPALAEAIADYYAPSSCKVS